MALTPGTRLGVYEVTSQIGEGGMGQVYRATDTKLKRQVAIKTLPPSLAADHERLGRGVEEPFPSTDPTLTPVSWSADGRFLMYMSIDPKTNADLWVVPMSGNAGERKPFVFLKTPFREAYGTFSPDGRWVAYHSHESGRPEIYVRPFVPPSRDASTIESATADKSASTTGAAAAAAGGQWQVSTAGGILPLWRSDGRELYYIDPDGAMMAAPIAVNGATVEPGAPVMLFPTRIYGGGAEVEARWLVTTDDRLLKRALSDPAQLRVAVASPDQVDLGSGGEPV